MRALITGISGFVGRHLARHLLASGDDVHGFAQDAGTKLANELGLEDSRIHSVDLLDAEAVEATVAAIAPEIVYHLAAVAHPGSAARSSDLATRVNVDGSCRVAEAAWSGSRKTRFLHVSSAAVYDAAVSAGAPIDEDSPLAPTSHYGRTKLESESSLRASARRLGGDLVIARPFNHTGPGQLPIYFCPETARKVAAIELGLAPPLLVTGPLDGVRDFTDVRDVVRAYRLIGERGESGAVYNVASGEGRRLEDVARALMRLSSRAIRLSPAVATDADQSSLVGAIDRLHERTGWAPEIPFAETLEDLFAEWKARFSAWPR